MSGTRKGNSVDVTQLERTEELQNQEERRRKKKRIRVESPEEVEASHSDPALDEAEAPIEKPKTKKRKLKRPETPEEASSAAAASSSRAAIVYPVIEEREFCSEDFDKLTVNEHNRFIDNSNKIGHAVIMKNEKGEDVALQYPIPKGDKEETPLVRQLVNIQAINPYGMRRYRAETPDGHTVMYAKRFENLELGNDANNREDIENLQIAYFSPSNKGDKEPFWGGGAKVTPLFRGNLKKSTQKELDKELKEIGTKTKGGRELVVHGPSVQLRDGMTRNPDQNTVMGGESARDAYEHFFDALTEELHPDMKKRLQRAFKADIRGWDSHYRPEWLHAEGFGLTPMDQNPQRVDNLGAAPKWSNTEMMILERIAKWFALNQPQALIKIKTRFEMLMDSELIKKIDFEVTIEEKNRFIKFIQNLDPFKEWPLFRKASDIAQGTAITYNLLHGINPISNEKIRNGSIGVGSTSKTSLSHSVPVAAAASSSAAAAASAVPFAASAASAFSAVSSSAKSAMLLKAAASSAQKKISKKMPTHLEFEKSIVQIYSTFQMPDYDTPWKGTDMGSCTGSGSVIQHAGKLYILTNAHVVENASKVRVRLTNDKKKKYEATRKCVSYQCDLALLEVTDPEFLALAKPVQLGKMVSLQQKVKTIGFPIGGAEISVTKGSVNRIEVRDYCMSGLNMIQVQIQAPLNPGNSGGPAFSGGKQVGVAFQVDRSGEGLNYIIPMPVIDHFLKEAFNNKPYRGFPVIPIATKSLENPSQRQYYGMTKDQTGILISSIDFLTDAYNKLQPGDILLEIDSMPLSNEGTVNVPEVGECLEWIHVTQMKFIGDTVRLKVLRRNQETKAVEIKNIDVVLDRVPLETEKVSQTEWDKMPTYFIASGISFTPLTRNYLEGKGSDFEEYYSIEHGCKIIDAPKKAEDDQLVVINEVLDCTETEGYDDYVNDLVYEVNGQKIRNLSDVIKAIESNKEAMHVITTSSKSKLVVKNMTKKEHDELLNEYHIKSDRSENLLAVSPNANSIAQPVSSAAAAASSAPAAVAVDGPVRMEIDDESDEEKEQEKKAELTAEDLPGYRKYRAKLDQMEAFYSTHQLDEEEDLSEDADDDYDDENSSESNASSSEEIESEEEEVKKVEKKSFTAKPVNRHGLFSRTQHASNDSSDKHDDRLNQRRFK